MKSKSVAHTLAIALFAACGGSDKQADEPAPVMSDTDEQPPGEEEAQPPTDSQTPPETPPAPETPPTPPAPEPKTLSEDLDGDGAPEAISLTGTDLKIGEVAIALPADKLAGKALEIKIIDLASKDRSRELVVVDPGTEDDAVWFVVTWAKGKAGEPVEVPVGSEPTIKGDGSLTVTGGKCGQTTTVTWKLAKGKLSKGKEKKKGKYDESKCAG